MKRVLPMCLLFLIVAIGAAPIRAQPESGVTVFQTGSHIKVSVQRPIPLGDVLNELCRRTNADGSGTQQAMSLTVPAREVSGDWRQVLAVLLDGADLNYVVGQPSGSSGGKLNIVGVISNLATPAHQSRPIDRAASSNQHKDVAQPSSDVFALPATTTAMTESSPEAGALATSADAAPIPASLQPSEGAAAPSKLSGASTERSTGRVLPFPDSFGNPIPATNQTAEYLPFPGPDGKPIPISNQPAQYLPFPGPDGKPIPVSNQPVQFLPFPDSDGRPIPVRPVTTH